MNMMKFTYESFTGLTDGKSVNSTEIEGCCCSVRIPYVLIWKWPRRVSSPADYTSFPIPFQCFVKLSLWIDNKGIRAESEVFQECERKKKILNKDVHNFHPESDCLILKISRMDFVKRFLSSYQNLLNQPGPRTEVMEVREINKGFFSYP